MTGIIDLYLLDISRRRAIMEENKIIEVWHKDGVMISADGISPKNIPKGWEKIKLIRVDDVNGLNIFRVADQGTIKIKNAQDYILIKKSDLKKLEGEKI